MMRIIVDFFLHVKRILRIDFVFLRGWWSTPDRTATIREQNDAPIDVYQHIDTPVGEIELIVTVEFETVPAAARPATISRRRLRGGRAGCRRQARSHAQPVRLSPSASRAYRGRSGPMSDLYAQAAAEVIGIAPTTV